MAELQRKVDKLEAERDEVREERERLRVRVSVSAILSADQRQGLQDAFDRQKADHERLLGRMKKLNC